MKEYESCELSIYKVSSYLTFRNLFLEDKEVNR